MRTWLLRRGPLLGWTLLGSLAGGVLGYTNGGEFVSGLEKGAVTAGGGAVGTALALLAASGASSLSRRSQRLELARIERNEVLDNVPFELPRLASFPPSSVLSAEREISPFRGRAKELAQLRTWCLSDSDPIACFIIGQSGVGKTRLALELSRLLPSEWFVGKLKPGSPTNVAKRILEVPTHTLAIVDGLRYRENEILDLLRDVYLAKTNRVKILVSVTNPKMIGILAEKMTSEAKPAITEAHTINLRTFGGADDLLRWLNESRAAFTAAAGKPSGRPSVRGPAMGSTMGYVQAQAYIEAFSDQPDFHSAASVAESLAHHERLQWSDPPFALSPMLDQCVAVLTLLEPETEDRAIEALECVPGLEKKRNERTRREIANWMSLQYPRSLVDSKGISRPSPSILAMGLIIPELRKSAKIRSRLFASRDFISAGRAIAFVADSTDVYPEVATWLRDELHNNSVDPDSLRAALLSTASPSKLLDKVWAEIIKVSDLAIGELEEAQQLLPEFAVESRAAIIRRILKLLKRSRSKQNLARRAELFHTLAYLLDRGPESNEAFALQQQAAIWRAYLAGRDPEISTFPLVGSLNNLANMTSSAGRISHAVAIRREVVRLLRAQPNQDAKVKEFLSATLSNLGKELLDAGRAEDALPPCSEALTLARTLVRDPSNAGAEDLLARTLTNLGNVFSDLSRHTDALKTRHEACVLLRRITEDAPGRSIESLAIAYTNYGYSLKEFGELEASLTMTAAASEIYRSLAIREPERYAGNLSAALRNHGAALAAVGRYKESLELDVEVAARLRVLASELPAAFTGDLATALTNLGLAFGRMDRAEDALPLHREAIDLLRPLAAEEPERFEYYLTVAMSNLAMVLSRLGDYNQAIAMGSEVVAARRAMADRNQDRFSSDLGDAQEELGLIFRRSDRLQESLEMYRQAVLTFRDLTTIPNEIRRRKLLSASKELQEVSRELGLEDPVPVLDLRFPEDKSMGHARGGQSA